MNHLFVLMVMYYFAIPPKAQVVQKFVKDDYGSYAPYSSKLFAYDKVFSYFDDMNMLTEKMKMDEYTYHDKYDAKLFKKLAKSDSSNIKRKLSNIFRVIEIYDRQVAVRITSDNIYEKGDTLILTYGIKGRFFILNKKIAKHFTLSSAHCLIENEHITYPIAYLYSIDSAYLVKMNESKKYVKPYFDVSVCD